MNFGGRSHLHSDHTLGLADVMFTPWIKGADKPLEIYGPEGIKDMVKYIHKAYEKDKYLRIYGLELENNEGWRTEIHELREHGIIYKDKNVKVEALKVHHGSLPIAFGYKFTTPDKIIVISGDNSNPELLLEAAKGADILIHEIYGEKVFIKTQPNWKKNQKSWENYFKSFHSSPDKLANMVTKAKPKLLVLYHEEIWSNDPDENAKKIRKIYKGKVISSKDLDIY